MNRSTFQSFVAWCQRYISITAILVIGLCVYVLCFNDNSLVSSHEYTRQIRELRQEIDQNRDTLAYYRQLNRSLDTDPATMERIVREQYHMQRTNEDVYIFEK